MATMRDLDQLCVAMPETEKHEDDEGRPSWQVVGKTFCFHRSQRPDAVDGQGERLADVLVLWVDSLEEKDLILSDDRGVFVTTPHWHEYEHLLTQIPPRRALRKAELREFVKTACLTRSPNKIAKAWLAAHGGD